MNFLNKEIKYCLAPMVCCSLMVKHTWFKSGFLDLKVFTVRRYIFSSKTLNFSTNNDFHFKKKKKKKSNFY